ncbi:MAG: Multidrug resistance protein MdtB [Chlamydiia bacterium]|nr:Multidrug resistance protein MdtB [Chlamydiia bacterium]MCH9616254.1 Multidrug resistance protein MdtB [Chlamydiia bacterium]MCH9629760.1 Multidrug resistance protein MdtB [Chlamydiia bacterium]
MSLTKFAFSKTQLTLLTIVLLVLSGVIAYFSMPRDENPVYIVRTAQVTTHWPGASPERVEQLVTDKIEKTIQEIPEVDYIKSESKTGISIITVRILDRYKHMRPIWDELRRKVEDAERELPLAAKAPIVNDDYGDIYGIVVGIVWDGFSYAEIKNVAEDVRDSLLEVPDVAKVDLVGTQDERVFINYNNDKLREIAISPEQLRQILEERNIIQSGGIIYGDIEQIAVEPTGNYETLEDIQETLIPIPNTNNIVRLADLANVYRGYIEPPRTIMHVNGRQSVGLAISMREGGNILTMGKQVTAVLDHYQEHFPLGIEFDMVAYQPERVVKKIDEFAGNLLQAILIVCGVMFLFLGLRTGFVIASLIPVVVLIAIFIMSLMHIGLNQVTLASLIIALGMLVDNAIVMSESIIVQTESGKKPLDAAIDSAKELKTSLLISSLTTSAAFLPFYLAKSGTGEYVGDLFFVVTITLLGSWVISLTMIPIFCVAILRSKKKLKMSHGQTGILYRIYQKFLLSILKCRYLSLGAVVGVFCLSIFGMGLVPKIFFPPSDTPMFTLELELPVSSSIYYTEGIVEEIENYIDKNLRKEGVEKWAAYIGSGGPRFRLQHDPEPPNTYYAFFLFSTTDYKVIPDLMENLYSYILNHYPDAKTKIRLLEEGTPVDNPVEVRITGKDVDHLYAMADELEIYLNTLDGTKSVNDNWGLKSKKIVIKVDQNRAKRAQITNADIARSLESALTGVTLSEFREDDELIPVIFRSEAATDVDLIGTEAFNVYSQSTGESVPLLQVAEVLVEWEPSIIFRRNRLKTITVFSEVMSGFTANSIDQKVMAHMEEVSKNWPIGYRYAMGGEEEESGKAQNSIFIQLPIAGLIIAFLLMLQFNSVKKMFIILMTIPLSIIGVVLGLIITDAYFGIMTILGLISLAGIIINNAIVLLDRIRLELEENGLSQQDAIIAASKQRLRPILLTTVTTAAGLLPLWFGGGLLWETMAIAIIFGLLVGTLLTLGFIPVLYAILNRVSYKDYTCD